MTKKELNALYDEKSRKYVSAFTQGWREMRLKIKEQEKSKPVGTLEWVAKQTGQSISSYIKQEKGIVVPRKEAYTKVMQLFEKYGVLEKEA